MPRWIALPSPRFLRAFSPLKHVLLILAVGPFFLPAAHAQNTASHPANVAHPAATGRSVYRTPASPVRTAPPQMMHIGSQPRPGWATHPPLLIAPRPATAIRQPFVFPGPDARAGFAAPRFVRPFFFDSQPFGDFGVPGSISQFGGLPLGFGLWPTCDSAATPGVFWSVGPCFGMGSYAAPELIPAAPSTSYLPPLILFSQPPSGAAPQRQATTPSGPPPTVTLYLSDGSTIVANDWWVAQGRLQYISASGQEGAVDVLKLDLDRTIKENQKHGVDFRLKFTPPSDAYPPSIRP